MRVKTCQETRGESRHRTHAADNYKTYRISQVPREANEGRTMIDKEELQRGGSKEIAPSVNALELLQGPATGLAAGVLVFPVLSRGEPSKYGQ